MFTKKQFISFVGLFVTLFGYSQNLNQIINFSETERIEKYLSSDALEGRKVYSKGIDVAANFIAQEFSNIGLQKGGNNGYLQSFVMLKPLFKSVSCLMDGVPAETKNVIAITTEAHLVVNETSGYEMVVIKKEDNFFQIANKYLRANKNYIVLVDESFASNFSRLIQFKNTISSQQKSVVYILTNRMPTTISIDAVHQIEQLNLSNVVGMIPGKSLPNEYVIFSGHYDHLGINLKNAVNGDSLFNGANDDAAGTTAMIMLAKYFASVANNERTLVFTAFTAEEVGGFGAQYFSKQFDPLQVKAMFNIEMIGTESKWGKNSAYITGFEKTDMGNILQKNLAGSGFTFYPDPYPTQNLFYRSDNATLARTGVPAHTISTSKMDSEPHYHKPSDQFETIDIANMTEIIKAIATSAQSIISGKDTPSRVDTTQLR